MDTFGGAGSDALSTSSSAHELFRPPAWAAQHPRPSVIVRRRDLPEQKEKAQKASLWTIVKESVGARPGETPSFRSPGCPASLKPRTRLSL